jgi:hypothetical protein
MPGTKRKRLGGYLDMIVAATGCGDREAVAIEGIMRNALVETSHHGCLDGLSRSAFDHEAQIAKFVLEQIMDEDGCDDVDETIERYRWA